MAIQGGAQVHLDPGDVDDLGARGVDRKGRDRRRRGRMAHWKRSDLTTGPETSVN